VKGERPIEPRTASVNDTLRNALVVEMGNFFAEMKVLDEQRATISSLERIVCVLCVSDLLIVSFLFSNQMNERIAAPSDATKSVQDDIASAPLRYLNRDELWSDRVPALFIE
jgi:hypothetical protein